MAVQKNHMKKEPKILALCGGIGGAKLALGLYRILPADTLTVAVNTGDDFSHLGFHISPDIDTVLYTLGGLSDTERGWGRADETWQFMAALKAVGGDDWFALGDKDLAVHVERTRRLKAGETLSAITQDFATGFGIDAQIVPMSDAPVRTMIETDQGLMAFQDYFVRERCEPKLSAIHYDGAGEAEISPQILALLGNPDLDAVILCPSNPYLSLAPMLAMHGFKHALADCSAPVVAVSPIIQGAAVKGPTAKIMRELGLVPNAAAIADYYRGILDGFILDQADEALAGKIDIATCVLPTLMKTLDDRDSLARKTLAFATDLAEGLERESDKVSELSYGG